VTPPRTFLSRSRKNETFVKWRKSYLYPQSHARNLARKASQTHNVLLIDVDIELGPSNLAQLLKNFLLHSTCKKCAFVIPTYEIASNMSFPDTKRKLLSYKKEGMARPFHAKVFLPNQKATNFIR